MTDGIGNVEELSKLVDQVLGEVNHSVTQKKLFEGDEKKEKKYRRLLRHTQRCFTVLLQKQASSQMALAVLRQDVWPSISAKIKTLYKDKNNDDQIKSLLHHLFQILIRLKDSFILLESGECRHEGDKNEALESKYKSRLKQVPKIYRGETYSGASWDEWNNKDVGLQSQWEALLPKKYWANKLAVLIAHTQISTVQQNCNDFFKDTVLYFLKEHFSRVKLILRDKGEEFEVRTPCGTKLAWKRFGKKFQLSDPQGVLPVPKPGKSLREAWLQILAPPALSPPEMLTKRKKRIILDGDEDEEREIADTSQKADNRLGMTKNKKTKVAPSQSVDGLVVSVRTAKPSEPSTTPSKGQTMSLDAIKRSMGADAKVLEQSYENAEAEAVSGDTQQVKDETSLLRQKTEHIKEETERRVQVLRCQLQRLQSLGNPATAELWGAREDLRMALMMAGNAFLWSNKSFENGSTLRNPPKRDQELKQAHKYFQDAAKQVDEQQSLIQKMKKLPDEDAKALLCRRRGLYLQAGQAEMNRGIVLLKLQRRDGAVQSLNAAIEKIQHFGALAISDRQEDLLDALCDELESLQQQSLACRWVATCLWQDEPRREQSMSMFRKAASFINDVPEICFELMPLSLSLSELRLELWTECYYSWTTAFESANDALWSIPAIKLREGTANVQWLLEVAHEAISGAADASKAIEKEVHSTVFGDLSDFIERPKNDILSSEELLSEKDAFTKGWEQRKTQLVALSRGLPTNQNPHDAFGNRLPTTGNNPTARITLASDGPRRLKKKGRNGGASFSNIRLYNESTETAPSLDNTVQYRTWGDELLVHKTDPLTGAMLPLLNYPCIAPDMPPDIAAIAKRMGHLMATC